MAVPGKADGHFSNEGRVTLVMKLSDSFPLSLRLTLFA